MTLTFQQLRDANAERCALWHPPHTDPWNGADWGNALAGESGERSEVVLALVAMRLSMLGEIAAGQACNDVKKLRRQETGARHDHDPAYQQLLDKLGLELADVILYTDLLAKHYGIDLEAAVRAKFNSVSEKYGFPQRL